MDVVCVQDEPQDKQPQLKDLRSICSDVITEKDGVFFNHGHPVMIHVPPSKPVPYNVQVVATMMCAKDPDNDLAWEEEGDLPGLPLRTNTNVLVFLHSYIAINQIPLCTVIDRVETLTAVDSVIVLSVVKSTYTDANVLFFQRVVVLQACIWFHITQVVREDLSLPVVQISDERGRTLFRAKPTIVSFAKMLSSILPICTDRRLDYELDVLKQTFGKGRVNKRALSELDEE